MPCIPTSFPPTFSFWGRGWNCPRDLYCQLPSHLLCKLLHAGPFIMCAWNNNFFLFFSKFLFWINYISTCYFKKKKCELLCTPNLVFPRSRPQYSITTRKLTFIQSIGLIWISPVLPALIWLWGCVCVCMCACIHICFCAIVFHVYVCVTNTTGNIQDFHDKDPNLPFCSPRHMPPTPSLSPGNHESPLYNTLVISTVK